jgi:hypothetical protein
MVFQNIVATTDFNYSVVNLQSPGFDRNDLLFHNPGNGYSLFTYCPQHDIPNYPDAVVEIDFSDTEMSTDVSVEHLRLVVPGSVGDTYVHPDGPIMAESGYVGRFQFLNPSVYHDCGPLEIRLQSWRPYDMDHLYLEGWWDDVEVFVTSVANYDLITTEDEENQGINRVNLADLAAFVPSSGTCGTFGDSDVDPCANFAPELLRTDFCINLTDVVSLAVHMNHGDAAKSSDGYSDNGNFVFESSKNGGHSVFDVYVDRRMEEQWTIAGALVQILGLEDTDRVEWVPDEAFEGISVCVLAPGEEDGTYSIVALGSKTNSSDRTKIGELHISDSLDRRSWEPVLAVESLWTDLAVHDISSGQESHGTDEQARSEVAEFRKLRDVVGDLDSRFLLVLPSQAHLTAEVFNLRGQRVATLYSGIAEAGPVDIGWSGRESSGRKVASGVYFLRVETDDFREVAKVVVIR